MVLIFYIYSRYIYYILIIYIYILYIGRTCLVAPMLLLIRMRSVCIQLNTNVIRGLVKRAQLLWNVHSISETCTYRILENTGWGRWNTLYQYIYIYIHYLVTSIIQIYQNICSILVAPHHRGGFLVHPQPLGAPLGINVFLKVGNQLKQAVDHHPYSLSPMFPGKIPVLHENNLPKAHGNFRSLQEMDHWFTALRRRHCHGSGGKSEFSASIHINSLYFFPDAVWFHRF